MSSGLEQSCGVLDEPGGSAHVDTWRHGGRLLGGSREVIEVESPRRAGIVW
jgi:hypothetical protein